VSDANSGNGLDGWFVPGQGPGEGAGPAAAPSPDAQPTQQIPAVPPQDAPPAFWTQQAPPHQQHQPQPQQPQYQPHQPQPQPHQQQHPRGQAAFDQAQAPYGHAQQPQAAPYPQSAGQGPFGGDQPPFSAPKQPFGPGMGLPDDTAGAPGWEREQERPKPRRTKLAVATGIGVAGIIGLATLLVMNQTGTAATAHTSAAATSPKPKPTPSGYQPTAKTAAAAALETAGVFLTAWQDGNFSKAAAYTDDPADAQSTLSAYRTGLNLRGLRLTPQGTATAAGVVTFAVSASVTSTGVTSADGTVTSTSSSASSTSSAASSATDGGSGSSTAPAATATSASGTWTYSSQLTAYKKNGGWWIKWDPALVAPKMTSSEHPVALALAPGAGRVTDASGGNLSSSSQTALQNIATLVKKNTKTSEGTAGLEIVLENSSGKLVSGSSDQLSKPVSTAVVKTTIDPSLQTLANTAVTQFPRSSMVVLRPSTGAILAVANSSDAKDTALTGTLAPGSSMKVITTTGLLVDGLLPQGISTHVGCPLVETVQGVKIHNSTSSPNSLSGTEDFEPPTTPFSTDFAQSCNNAFTQWWQQMAGGKLASAASTYYGLNQPWDIGLGTKGTYFSMPSHQSGSELAEELYGQGLIEANPLSMASVAATVDTGQFHQPYLVSGLSDKVSATPLPSSVRSQLYTVMREVVTSGTAASVGFGSGVYGKTGTAEADANKDHNPNGWMIVFDPSKDLAVAAVVVDSNFGASTAGPETNYVLQHS